MGIDWKQLAKSPGYQSLKAAYIKDVQDAMQEKAKGRQPMRDKTVFLKHFQWIINRAKHYAHVKNTSMEAILNEWESGRRYWWLNYYKECNQPKLIVERRLKPLGVKGYKRKLLKSGFCMKPEEIKGRVKNFINNQTEKTKKERWSAARKRRGY